MSMDIMGFFIIYPRQPTRIIDRDFAIMLHNWAVHPDTYRPDPSVMTEFDLWTFNSKIYPAAAPMTVKTGERVRIRLGNLSMHEHPMHIHGVQFRIAGTDAGAIPKSAQWPASTVLVPVGTTRDIEFVADLPVDWAFHCHKVHHTMNAMGHSLSNPLGVDQHGVEERIQRLLPGYMAIGKTGMGEHMHMEGPENTVPMMSGTGQYRTIGMGMFTIIKVRDDLKGDADPGWYRAPQGTVA